MPREEGLAALREENARLRETLELLQEAADTVRHGLCMFDEQGRIAYCNQRYPEVIGSPPEKIRPGLAMRELLALAQRAGHYPAERSLDELEAEFRDKLSSSDRTPRYLNRNGRTYLIRSDRTTGGKYVATFEDITAQMEAESALRQSEARLSAMLDTMPDCVKIFDEAAQLRYINPKGLELLEAPSLAALIDSGHMAVPVEYLAECVEVHRRVIGGETVVWSYEILGMNGGRKHVEAHAVPFRMPDGARAHMSITRDIAARRQAEDALRRSEERLRVVQDAAGLADFENDCGEVTVCSDSFFEQVGLPKGDGTITIWQWLDLIHPEDRDRVTREMEEAIEHADIFSTEYRIVRADTGEVRWVCCRTKLIRDENGKAIKTIGAHRDITPRKEREEALRRSEERLRLVQEASDLAEFEADHEGISFSRRFVQQAGLPPGTTSLSNVEWLATVHPDDRDQFLEEVERSLEANSSFDFEFRIIRADNDEVRWISSRTRLKLDEAGRPLRSIGAHLDITERKLAEQALRESEERFRLAAEAAGLGVWDYDELLDRRDWSGRLREIFGLAPDVAPSTEIATACVCPEHREPLKDHLKALKYGQKERFETVIRIHRADDGRERWIAVNGWRTPRAENGSTRIIATVRDVTEEKTAEQRIQWSATHDGLTRLANRAQFQEKLDHAVGAARREGHAVGVLVLDLDHFKQVNDSLGHDVGDALLKMIADRLREVVRPDQTVARLGGDEFAIVVPRLESEIDLIQLSRAIQDRMREPFVHQGRILDCRVSSGAAVFPLFCSDTDGLLKNADVALYAAKAAGRATVTMFEPQMRDDIQRRSAMVRHARSAIRDDRVIPYYQPKLGLVGGTLEGFEALLRWRMPNGRIGLPGALEAAFEDLEVAAAISDRMIERVIADMRRWLDRGTAFEHVAVNASAAEFRRDNFAERLLEELRRAEIPTRCFQLEVTETVFLGRGAEYVHRALALLSAQGVRIALDDFGTGYASLRHLKQFPVDIIKIDRSFVRDMETDPGDEAIVRAVVNLGKSLRIGVVAEGIETESHAARLLELGCDFGQGFLFSPAVGASRVPTLIRRLSEAAHDRRKIDRNRQLRLVASQT